MTFFLNWKELVCYDLFFFYLRPKTCISSSFYMFGHFALPDEPKYPRIYQSENNKKNAEQLYGHVFPLKNKDNISL